MSHRTACIAAVLASLLVAAALAAEDRLAVLELFGRKQCGNCQAAGETLTTLQAQLGARAILLEYDYDAYRSSLRVNRFWQAAGSAAYLPLVMVGSGYRTSSGPVSYERVYQGLIDDELARPPEAAVVAYFRRSGDTLRVYVRAVNTGSEILSLRDQPTLWVVAWERRPIGVSSAFVRAALPLPLSAPLAPGGRATAVIDTPPLQGVDWSRMASLALFERWVGNTESGHYDALQAAVALPAALAVTPRPLTLSAGGSAALTLEGPHVLTWTATSDVDWLQVEPSSGTLPASPTVSLAPGRGPVGAAAGTLRIEATGDGMTFAQSVQVAVQAAPPRSAERRLRPSGR